MASRTTLVENGLEELARERVLERVWEGDASLWTADRDEQAICARRLGWLKAPEEYAAHVAELQAFASEAVGDGIRTVVLLGMGGSSLGAEVYAQVLGSVAGTATLRLLDSTSPEAIEELENSLNWERSLFIVASKSGTTVETDCLRRYFWNKAVKKFRERAGHHFVAITDPGSELLGIGLDDGYRKVFENNPEIGGRYAVLSYFGLVPAVLLGINIGRVMETACAEARASRDATGDGARAVLRLAATIGACARAGRDKLVLQCSRRLEPFGAWAEQLIAESTGKQGRGSLPIADAPQAGAGPDRVHLRLVCGGDPSPQGPTPDLEIAISDPHEVGALFFRFELATALASALIGVEPFDQPNVAEAKQATKAVLKSGAAEGRNEDVLLETPDVVLSAPPETGARLAAVVGEDRHDLGPWLRALAGVAQENSYLALLAYVAPSPARTKLLQELRHTLAEGPGVVSSLGYGPRYLHSTGQYHKGGPATGVFLLIEGPVHPHPLPIRGLLHTFGELFHAQAEGDARALALHRLPLLRVRLRDDADRGLAALRAALETA